MEIEQSSTGQDTQTWHNWWKDLTPEKEIQKWDFYGLRPWIMKFTPRHGKVLEAGCGLGRWVLLLSKLGIDIEGVDFEKATIDYLNDWKKDKDMPASFKVGDVTDLPYDDDSISGYLSFGVVEHFQEGPHKAFNEAYRVLRPGGVAVITTPSISWYIPFKKGKQKLKRIAKKMLGKKVQPLQFFQYEYRPAKLAKHVRNSGLRVTKYAGNDILYTFFEKGKHTGKNIAAGSMADRLSRLLENSWFARYGAQSITISVKTAELMHCFLCGERDANMDSLDKYDVPICSCCQDKPNAAFYRKAVPTKYHHQYLYRPPILPPQEKTCAESGKTFMTDPLFEQYGFGKPVSPESLQDPKINIRLSNTDLQPVWRNRTEI